MTPADALMLYKRIRCISFSHGKSPKYEKWLKARHPGKSWHHVTGSVHGRKSTDYLSVMVSPEEHALKQNEMDWIIEQLPKAIDNLLTYVEEKI